MHFWGSIWPGSHLVVILSNLVPVKWKKHIIRIARFASGLSSGGCRPYPRFHQGPQWSILPIQELIFIAVIFWSISIAQLTALFKNPFWSSIWPGSHLVVILSNSAPVKWKKHMFPIARYVITRCLVDLTHIHNIYHWMKTQGIGTNVCHAGCKGHVSYLRFKKEQKEKEKNTLWAEMKTIWNRVQ